MSGFGDQLVQGLLNPKGNVADWRHASRLFVDSDFRLAPKSKFNFYVNFSINTNALKSLNFSYRHASEINMLVKTCELPKFTIDTVTADQYNRKHIIQTKINYLPVNITFHDDRLGVVNQLWQNYYSYYYADPTVAKQASAYKNTAYSPGTLITAPYGLDNNSSIPFFDKITIYQMANHQYQSYTLVNPKIASWSHDSMDMGSNQAASQAMSIVYEAVSYNTGPVIPGSDPPGFGGPDHYDTVPSPLSLAGGGTQTLLGTGGVLAGLASTFGVVGQVMTDGLDSLTTGQIVGAAITAVNTYNNASKLTSTSIKNELTNVANTSIQNLGNVGLNNIRMPVNDTANNTATVATQRQLP
jgi:hypothetical protein